MRMSLVNRLYRYWLVVVATAAILMLTSLSALAEEGTAEADPTEAGDDDDDDGDDEGPAEEAPKEPAAPAAEAPVPDAAEVPAPAPAPPAAGPEQPTVGYQEGFFIASPGGAFKLTVNGRVQVRFTLEKAAGKAGDGKAGDGQAQFSIPRTRLKLKGHAFDTRVAFALEIDFGKGDVSLKDALVDFDIIDHKLMVRVGQFKRPFSRQQLTSSARQQFVDRAITDKHFDGGRDLGVMLHSHEQLPFEYSVGLFNGSGDKGLLDGKGSGDQEADKGEVTSGKDSKVLDLMDPMVVARFGWHSEGFDGYTESDYRGSDFGIGIGGGVVLDFDSDDDDDSAIRAGIDYALAVQGLSSTGGVYVATAQDGEGFGDQGFDSVGFHVQAGYVIKGRVEPAVRYARLMPAGGGASQEFLGGVNVFFHNHSLKWSTDFGVLTEEAFGDDRVDFRARSQVQLSF